MSPEKIEVARIIASILTAYAWPIGIIAVCIFFKEPLRGLLNRIVEVSGGNLSLKAGSQPSQPQEIPANLKDVYDLTPESIIKEELPKVTPIIKSMIGAGGNQEQAYLTIITSLAVATRYNYISGVIYGSQLKVLLALNTQGKMPRENAATYYQAASTQSPSDYKSISFDQWLGFLLGQGLVVADKEVLAITNFGRGLLNFMIKQQHPIERKY